MAKQKSTMSRRSAICTITGGFLTTAPSAAASPPWPEGTNATWIIATQRMKFLVRCFENYYIDDAFDRDHANIVAEAERMLRFCEAQQAGAPEDLDGEDELAAFMRRYNQSLDWLFDGQQHVLICALASHRPIPQREVANG